MHIQVNWHIFQRVFQCIYAGNQFGYKALRALFEYLENYEEDTGVKIELDVIAICSEFREIEEDEDCYRQYVGDDAPLQDLIIATFPTSILVREG